MKAILLARVSSREQQEGMSILAQERRLREYAERRGLVVDQVFAITESSTRGARKEFEKVIQAVRKTKEPVALIADTVDRIQRSFKESFVLDDLRKSGKVEIHFVREGLVLNSKANSVDIMRWDMGVMFAKNYVLQMSDNIVRAKEQAAKSGIWMGRAPVGYLNTMDQAGKKTILPDLNLAPFIRKMFELYAKGTYSLSRLQTELTEMGARTKREIHQSESEFHRDSLKALRSEQDKLQRRVSQIYDDKLDGLIDETMYLEKVREYKGRQAEILEEMKRHEVADQNFHVTANMVLKLAARAREIYESSEVEEKRQLLNYVFQNLRLDSKTLLVETHEPFSMVMGYKQCPTGRGADD